MTKLEQIKERLRVDINLKQHLFVSSNEKITLRDREYLVTQFERSIDLLDELVDIFDNGQNDSFTTQPANEFLEKLNEG